MNSSEEVELDSFHRWAAYWMILRLREGAKKFGTLSWRKDTYTDAQNVQRLYRAVDHLTGVLWKWRDPETAEFIDVSELGKRAADVANQAFFLADIRRQEEVKLREMKDPGVSKMETAVRKAVALIEVADNRAMAADGPVGHVRDEMSDSEWRELYVGLKEALEAL